MRMLLMSHGPMAQATLASAEMIVGKLPNAYAVGLSADQSAADFQKAAEYFLEQNLEEETVAAIDFLGGTPSDVVLRLMVKYPRLQVISGINLPMVIEFANQALTASHLSKTKLLAASKNGIVDVNSKLRRYN